MLRRCLHLFAALVLAGALAGCASSPAMNNAGADFDSAREAFVAGDYERALPLFTSAAENGTPRAQYILGYMYYNGLGVAADEHLAMNWLRRAANNGDPKAINALSRLAHTMTREAPLEAR